MTIAKRIVLLGLIGVVGFAACRSEKTSGGTGPSHDVHFLCTRCAATGTLQLAAAAKDEIWPQECPSCKRWGAYASAECGKCGKPVAMVDARTSGYGTPTACPHCNTPWPR